MLFDRLLALALNEKVITLVSIALLVAIGFLCFLAMFINYFPEFGPIKAGTIPAPKGRG